MCKCIVLIINSTYKFDIHIKRDRERDCSNIMKKITDKFIYATYSKMTFNKIDFHTKKNSGNEAKAKNKSKVEVEFLIILLLIFKKKRFANTFLQNLQKKKKFP